MLGAEGAALLWPWPARPRFLVTLAAWHLAREMADPPAPPVSVLCRWLVPGKCGRAHFSCWVPDRVAVALQLSLSFVRVFRASVASPVLSCSEHPSLFQGPALLVTLNLPWGSP